MTIIEVNKDNFDKEVLESENQVLADFNANWCGPCRMMAPIVEEVAKNNTTCKFYKLDVDEAESIARKYGIMSIPTLLLFEEGTLVQKNVGFMSKEDLESFVK